MRAATQTRRLPFFVYGTLRHGEGNYNGILAGRTVNERRATFTGGAMHSNGGFPFVTVIPGTTDTSVIIGDLMDINPEDYASVLVSLDRLEGYRGPGREHNMYDRIEVDVLTADGDTVRAYTYIASASLVDHVLTLAHMPSGDWITDGPRRYR